jgi:hypothetical protein
MIPLHHKYITMDKLSCFLKGLLSFFCCDADELCSKEGIRFLPVLACPPTTHHLLVFAKSV